MKQPPFIPRAPDADAPDTPDLSARYSDLRRSADQLLVVMKATERQAAALGSSDREQDVCDALWRVSADALLHVMYNQESINVLVAVRSTDLSVRSRVAKSVTCNLSWAGNSVADMMEEARDWLDALDPKSEVRTVRLAELLLLSLELARRELEGLAIALRSDSW